MAGEGKKRWSIGAADERISSTVPTEKREIANSYHGSTVMNQAIKGAGTVAAPNIMRVSREPPAAVTVYGLDMNTSDGEKKVLILNLGSAVSEVSLNFKMKATGRNAQVRGQDSPNRTVNNIQFAPRSTRPLGHPHHERLVDPEFDPANRPPSLSRSISHSSHPLHGLQQKTHKEYYTCDGCKMRGFGSRYSCEKCTFNLHEKCAFSSENSPATSHFLLRNSTFKFYHRDPHQGCTNAECVECYRRCEACAKPTKGFGYYEEGKDKARGFTFHPCCFNLRSKFSADDIEYVLCANPSSNCLLCNKKQLRGTVTGNTGWAYVSKCQQYNFHVFCTMEMPLEKAKGGDFSSVLKKTNLNTEKRGKNSCKIVTSFLRVVLGLLLGDPFNTFAGFLGIATDLTSN